MPGRVETDCETRRRPQTGGRVGAAVAQERRKAELARRLQPGVTAAPQITQKSLELLAHRRPLEARARSGMDVLGVV